MPVLAWPNRGSAASGGDAPGEASEPHQLRHSFVRDGHFRVTWNDHGTCRDTACISVARAGLVSFGEALRLVCSLMRRATTAAATWKRLEAGCGRTARVTVSRRYLTSIS